MSTPRQTRTIGLFFLALACLNFPMMALFGKLSTVFGLPMIYGYLFSIWLLIIIALYLLYRKQTQS